MPAVSIIIPNYNHSHFLTKRVESVLNQTFQDFEVILMDDCSTDNSQAVLEQYRSNPKVSHLVFNDQNSGSTFKQWEKGIALAKGNYIWLAESDDWCEPSFLEHLMEGFNKDPECVISYCQSCVFDENVINWISSNSQLSEFTDGKSFARERLLINNPIFNASMVLWKRELFPQISKEFKNYKLCGDWLFWMELANLGRVHISGRVLNYFRQHNNNVSGKSFKSGLNFIETLQIINLLYQREMISSEDYDKAYKTQFKNYYKVKNNLNPDFLKEIKRMFINPLTSRKIYIRMFFSAVWSKVKH